MREYIHKRKKAFGFAFKGIAHFFLHEAHARIHLVMFVIVLGAGFYLKITRMEWAAVLLAASIVFVSEMINSAIEQWLDVSHPEFDPKVGKVKDIAAGAVLIASILAAAIGVIVFLPYFFDF